MSPVTESTQSAEPAVSGQSMLEMLVARRPAKVDRARYRKLSRFFFRAAAHIIWWDVILDRPSLQRFRKPPIPRWKELAREFREFAVESGGVMIKLGQFLSARVDLLPREVTQELKTLRDAVPPAPADAVMRQVEEDFGRPIAEVFPSFHTIPLGAASLAQAHAATLPDGTRVVVKVLRPGIGDVVETDLAVIGVFLKRLGRIERFRKQLDPTRLHRELSKVTRKELDPFAEGRNAERFAAEFAADPGIYVPKIHWDFTAARTLTMEDVGYIPIDDREAIRAAGIELHPIADKLFDCYLEQILIHSFVHVDPHGGNLFVRPLPTPAETRGEFQPGETAPYAAGRPFQLAFVDFGMAVQIPKRIQSALRSYVIGIVAQDSQAIIQAYIEAGMLAPDADLKAVEDMTNAMLDRFAGTFLGQMQGVNATDYMAFLSEYQELLYDSPFVLQIDLLYVFRALGMLSGMIFHLNPRLDPMARARPMVTKMARSQIVPSREGAIKTVTDLVKLPGLLMEVLNRVSRDGNGHDGLPIISRKADSLERAIKRLTWVLGGLGLVVAGTSWESAGLDARTLPFLGFAMSGAGVLTALAGFFRRG